MRKSLIISIFLVLILCIILFIYNNNRIIVSKDHFSKNECIKTNPLAKKVYIPNVIKNNIANISITLYAKDADTITYTVQNNYIKEHKNGIIVPVKYLVADKKTTVKISIKQKDGSITNKKIKIKVNIRNNDNIIFYSDNDITISTKNLPDFTTNKNILNNNNLLFCIQINFALSVYDAFYSPFLIIDSRGNIRSILKSYIQHNFDISYITNKKTNIIPEREQIYVNDKKLLSIFTDKQDSTKSDKILVVNIHDKTFNIIDLKKSLKVENIINIDTDWIHTNSIFYDNNDNSIIVSGKNIGIFKISIDGNLKWCIPNRFSKYYKYFKNYSLKVIDSNGNISNNNIQNKKDPFNSSIEDFEWPLGQHCVKLIDRNHIVCFDNGFFNYDKLILNKNYSRVVIYEIDENKRTIKQVWQYGKELGKDFYSRAKGYIEILDNNNLLIISPFIVKNLQNSKSSIKIININDKNVLFDMNIDFKNLIKLTELKDKHYDDITIIKPFYVK